MKNSCYYKNQDLLIQDAKTYSQNVETLEHFMNKLYDKLEQDEPYLTKEEYRKRVNFITSIEYKLDCAEYDMQTSLGTIENEYLSIINVSQTEIEDENKKEVNEKKVNLFQDYLLGKGEDKIQTEEVILDETKNSVNRIINTARNFSAFYNTETKKAIENLFLLEGEIEELKILQNKTKSKTKRKNLKKQELDKTEKLIQQISQLESYYSPENYFPKTPLTQREEYDQDTVLDSIQHASEYYFNTQSDITDGGKIKFETLFGSHYQSYMNLSDSQKELLKHIDSLDAGLSSPDFDHNAKQVFQDKKNKYVFKFLKSLSEYKDLMSTREALELENELEALSPSPVIEMSPEEQKNQFISYFSGGIGIESQGEDEKSTFNVDIFGNSMTTSLNYSRFYELFPEIFDEIFQLQSNNQKMQIEIEKLKEKKLPVPPSRIQDREIAILKNNQTIIYYLGELYKEIQNFQGESECESDDENDGADQIKFDYYFGDGDSLYESGNAILSNGDKKIYQNYTNLSPEQKELIIQIHALGVDIDRFSFVLEKHENEGNAEKAMKIIQGIETLYKKQDELIKIFFASQKKN